MQAEKLGPVDILERFLRSNPNKSCYLKQGTRVVNGVKHCRLQGHLIRESLVRKAFIDAYGSWPKPSELLVALKNEKYYSAPKKKWRNYTKRNLEAARTALSCRVCLSLIQQDIIVNDFDPLNLNIPPEIIALVVGMFAADGLFVQGNGVARIRMTRPFFEDLFKSIAANSNGYFHVVDQQPSSGQSTKRMVEIELAPDSKEGTTEHIKLAAWLICCFGPSVRKSKGFSPYPKEIAKWPTSLKRVFALGYFIGDGSITIGKIAADRNKPTAGVNLFCKPRVLPAEYYSSVEMFIRQCLDDTFSINNQSSKSNYIGANSRIRRELVACWEALQVQFGLHSCYKLDCMKLVDMILSHEAIDAFNQVLEPIMQVSLVSKPDNINEIASQVLADATALELVAKPGDRYAIPSKYFDPEHPESKAQLYGVEEAQLLYDEVYRFYSQRNATHNPATTRAIGVYLRKHRAYKSYFEHCDEATIGRHFISVTKKRGEFIPRIVISDILTQVDPERKLISQCLLPDKRANRETLMESFCQLANAAGFKNLVEKRLKHHNGKRHIKDALIRYYFGAQ